jgi:Fe-S oxidoreductase
MLGEPLGFDVFHSTQLLADLIEQKSIEFGSIENRVTYHDPCDLGRNSGIYDEPRFVLEHIPGVQLTEMIDHRERALCCGGGGGVEIVEPALTAAIARRRLRQAEDTGASTLVSACQQCKRTLSSAAREMESSMRVQDLTELVWTAIGART